MNSEEYNFNIPSEACKEIRKTRIPSDHLMMHMPQNALKRSRSDICDISDHGSSKFSKKFEMTLNSPIIIQENTDKNALEKSTSKHTNVRNANFVESFQSDKKSKKIYTMGENTTSNKNISHVDSSGHIANIGEFRGIQNFSRPDIATIPGLSHLLEKYCRSNINRCSDIFETKSPSNLQTENIEMKPAICPACNQKKMFEHFEISEETKIYKCCQCHYNTKMYDCFVTHIYKHCCNPFYCDACKSFYSDESLHFNQWECKLCEKYFVCKGELEDHYFSHEKHHKSYCRNCENEIYKHISDGEDENVYKCCEKNCSYKSDKVRFFRQHLYKHSSLKVYKCNQCGSRFDQKHSLNKHLRTPENCY